jgi:hypothetical protein
LANDEENDVKSVEENVEEIVEESASELSVLILETATDHVWKAAAAKVVLIPGIDTAAAGPRNFCVVARPPLPCRNE